MGINYENRPQGTSRREWKAQQTGQPMPYAPKMESLSVKNVYSASNIGSAANGSSSKPDFSKYNIDKLNSQVSKLSDSVNRYDLNTEKIQRNIEGQGGLGLIPMGRQANEAARISSIGRTGLANQLQSASTLLGQAKDMYSADLGQYNQDRSYELQEKQFAFNKAKLNQPSAIEKLGQATVNAENSLRGFVQQNKGVEGYDQKVSPDLYVQQRQNYILSGGSLADFDTQFGTYLSDQEKARLGVNVTAGLTAGQATLFSGIINKYNASPLVAAADRTVVLKDTIDSIKKDPNNGALQLNLVYSYVQALDTYQSAVREGELGLVNSIDSKTGQLKNYVQQIQNGQIVRPEVAKQIANAAEEVINTINSGAKMKAESFKSQAETVGLGDKWNQYISGFNQNYNQSNVVNQPDTMNIDADTTMPDGTVLKAGTKLRRGSDGNYYPI